MSISISAIVPVYNVENYLAECIESILNQSEKFSEVILVNDGSTDNSLNICKNYEELVPYIKIVNQDNAGLSAARNIGMNMMQSEYITFIDSDDYIYPDYVSTLKKRIMQNKGAQIIYFGADSVYEGEVNFQRLSYSRSIVNEKGVEGKQYFRQVFPSNYITSACLAVYRKDFLLNAHIDFPKGLYYEDNVFQLKVILAATKIVSIPEKLYIRRYRNNSIMTGNISEKKCKDLMEITEMCWNEMLAGDIERQYADKYCAYIFVNAIIKILDYSDFLFIEKKLSLYSQRYIEKAVVDGIEVCDDLCILLAEHAAYSLVKLFDKAAQIKEKIIKCLKEKNSYKYLKQDNLRIAIYGIGKSTQAFLDIYERLIGQIKSDLYFVTTNTIEKEYRMKKVVDIENLQFETDYFLIPSMRYFEEMKNNLTIKNVCTEKIVCVYDRDDWIDYNVIETILNMNLNE